MNARVACGVAPKVRRKGGGRRRHEAVLEQRRRRLQHEPVERAVVLLLDADELPTDDLVAGLDRIASDALGPARIMR